MSTSSPATTQQLEWLALALTPGLGATRSRHLVDHFGNADRVFHASLTELEAVGLQPVSAQAIFNGESLAKAEEEVARATAVGAEIITLSDDAYPSPLRQIYDPPVCLYVIGNKGIIGSAGIAVIGTRHPTPYGIGMASRLSCDLAARGIIIISGMARGVDSAAHRGAIEAKGKTVAVFGTGVDVIYPRENQKLSEQILALGGALISEFPLGTFAAPQNFPIRNRIISGLSIGVLVIEAGEYSGTRITARCALEQGREVFAVPGNVTNKNSWGPNTLIKQGAKLTATWEDVWEEIPPDLRLQLAPEAGFATKGGSTASLFEQESLAPQERKIFQLLRADEAVHIDEIVERLADAMSSSEIFASLFELEMSGRVKQLPGKNYVKTF
ncbi:MAG TPA: DNA-processing protein DprA [Terriglobales bacterium]|nr:DNA-processing protein DprA [Terriglobales bacterium]